MIDARAYVTNPQGRYKVPWSDVIGIAVHHSVSGGQFFTGAVMFEADELNHIRMIDSYHVSLGYGGFGYHLAAFPSGRLYLCGDLDGARAHVASRNAVLRGVVLIGDFTARDPGAGQVRAGAEGVAQVRMAAGAPLPLAGHRTWALPEYPTSCPGDRLAARLGELEHYEEDDMTDEEHRMLKRVHDWLFEPAGFQDPLVASGHRPPEAAIATRADWLNALFGSMDQLGHFGARRVTQERV